MEHLEFQVQLETLDYLDWLDRKAKQAARHLSSRVKAVIRVCRDYPVTGAEMACRDRKATRVMRELQASVWLVRKV